MGASPPQMSGPLGGPLARDPQRDKRYPFVRCLFPWEDPWRLFPVAPHDGACADSPAGRSWCCDPDRADAYLACKSLAASETWHWCALAPGHEDACECTCGARKLAAGRKSETAGAKAFRKLRGQVVA